MPRDYTGHRDSLEKLEHFIQDRASVVNQRVFGFQLGLFAEHTNRFHEKKSKLVDRSSSLLIIQDSLTQIFSNNQCIEISWVKQDKKKRV